jgi:Uma2 family endonuclease
MSSTMIVSFEEFEQLPDAPGKRELIDGEVFEMPPPKALHTVVARRLFLLLLSGTCGENAYQEAGFRLAGGWVQPDVSVLHEDQELENGYFSGAPLLAVEVISPANTAAQIDRKTTLYFAGGAREVWVVHPQKRWMTVFQGSGDDVRRIAVSERYHSPNLGVTVELARIFAG